VGRRNSSPQFVRLMGIASARGWAYNSWHMNAPNIIPTGRDTVMKTLGTGYLFLVLILLAAGLSLGQTETVEENPGQVEYEVGEVPADRHVKSSHNTPFGIRAGYTNWKSYDQFHFGGHAYLGELWPNIEFTPNVEVGFGNDVFIMTLNADVTYLFSEFVRYPWGLYGGGSLSFNLVNPGVGDSTNDLGFSVLAGTRYSFSNDHIGMFEIRAGLIDSPDIKLTFGYTLF
jgi:hypothetical protein